MGLELKQRSVKKIKLRDISKTVHHSNQLNANQNNFLRLSYHSMNAQDQGNNRQQVLERMWRKHNTDSLQNCSSTLEISVDNSNKAKNKSMLWCIIITSWKILNMLVHAQNVRTGNNVNVCNLIINVICIHYGILFSHEVCR